MLTSQPNKRSREGFAKRSPATEICDSADLVVALAYPMASSFATTRPFWPSASGAFRPLEAVLGDVVSLSQKTCPKTLAPAPPSPKTSPKTLAPAPRPDVAGAGDGVMEPLNGHEAGNGGHSQGASCTPPRRSPTRLRQREVQSPVLEDLASAQKSKFLLILEIDLDFP